MKHKHKVRYFVQDWRDLSVSRSAFWWVKGAWRQCTYVEGTRYVHWLVGSEMVRASATNQKHCKTKHSAMHQVNSLLAKGGSPLLSKWYYSKGRLKYLAFVF